MMYQRRMFILRLILINILLLSIANGVSAWDYLTRPEWKEAPILPAGLRTGMLELVPGFSGVSDTGIRYTVNEWGYRDDPINPDKRHVVFLGDSTTFGLDVQHEDTYSEVWEALIGADWQAINTAIPGHGTITEYAELRKLVDKNINLAGIVVGFYAKNANMNQWDNTTWENSADYLRRIQALAQTEGVPFVIVYLPSRASDVLNDSLANETIIQFTQQEHIPLIDGRQLYRDYMIAHNLTTPDSLFSVPGHPGVIGSRLLGQALTEVIR